MRNMMVIAPALFALVMSAPSNAQSETREEYLARLKDICSVDCLKPRDFRRKARKQRNSDAKDMAIMMDVRAVRRAGEKFELLSADPERNPLVTQAILGSAGINTSGSNGIGGLPGNSRANTTPDLIIIELDEQAFLDFLNAAGWGKSVEQAAKSKRKADDDQIIVEAERDKKVKKPTIGALSKYFSNRRVVVRGTPRLEAAWVGARRDFRRKQVPLQVDNADDLAILPRYDEKGEPIKEDLPWTQSEEAAPAP